MSFFCQKRSISDSSKFMFNRDVTGSNIGPPYKYDCLNNNSSHHRDEQATRGTTLVFTLLWTPQSAASKFDITALWYQRVTLAHLLFHKRGSDCSSGRIFPKHDFPASTHPGSLSASGSGTRFHQSQFFTIFNNYIMPQLRLSVNDMQLWE